MNWYLDYPILNLVDVFRPAGSRTSRFSEGHSRESRQVQNYPPARMDNLMLALAACRKKSMDLAVDVTISPGKQGGCYDHMDKQGISPVYRAIWRNANLLYLSVSTACLENWSGWTEIIVCGRKRNGLQR